MTVKWFSKYENPCGSSLVNEESMYLKIHLYYTLVHIQKGVDILPERHLSISLERHPEIVNVLDAHQMMNERRRKEWELRLICNIKSGSSILLKNKYMYNFA